ncbi:MAG: acylphosphatase [Planctomycetota bacterium]
MKRIHVIFRGFVQGVGFRWTAISVARAFAVTGFVRNLPDGAVELVAEGKDDELARFLDGISAEMESHIHDREITWTAPTGEFDRFGIAG